MKQYENATVDDIVECLLTEAFENDLVDVKFMLGDTPEGWNPCAGFFQLFYGKGVATENMDF